MRILNRAAQRYLVRRATSRPVVGIPGPDLVTSTDWVTERAGSAGTLNLVAPAGRPLGSEGVFEVEAWRLEPAEDGSRYHYIVAAHAPETALHLTGDAAEPGDLDVAVGRIRREDWTAMWLLQDDCVADARSVHLRYPAPSGLSVFYVEVVPGETPPGTYLCAYGFGVNARGHDPGGYVGIQERPNGQRMAIFSVWHRLIDEERPVPDALATAVAVHTGAYETPFSGEGSGTSIRLPIDWRAAGGPIRFAVTAEELGSDTVLSAYVALGNAPWFSLGAILRARTGGRLMSNPYSFIEDFARTGNTEGVAIADRSPYQIRSAQFGNPWHGVTTSSQDLVPVAKTKVTAYSPHPLENVAAKQMEPYGVYLATGTPSADRRSPIGATFQDPSAANRLRPRLDGVPF